MGRDSLSYSIHQSKKNGVLVWTETERESTVQYCASGNPLNGTHSNLHKQRKSSGVHYENGVTVATSPPVISIAVLLMPTQI